MYLPQVALGYDLDTKVSKSSVAGSAAVSAEEERSIFFFQSKVYTYPISLCSGKFLHSILGKYQKFSVVGREEHELPALSHFLLF